ncbi:MAG: hypothetical protein ABI779_10415 [Acidobacteriota bacterium]
MDDRDFVAAFENRTLPAAEFSHRAHVRLAWLYLREQPLLEALPRFANGLKRYATHLGAAAKYHETITWAYLFLIHERMQGSTAATFDEFAGTNVDLFTEILSRYYSPALLGSVLARTTFVMPDV